MSFCLNSIKQQSFEDYEVVIVDGGSTDNTMSIVNSIELPKIVNITPGCGLYQGLNIGINLATGHWLYFIGCDDKLYNEDVLKNISDVIKTKAKRAKQIFGRVYCHSQNELLIPRFGYPVLMMYNVHHQGIVYDRKVFENLNYDENRRVASDYELNLKLYFLKIPYIVMNETFCLFEGNGTSEMHLTLRNREIRQIHREIFGTAASYIVNGLFIVRTIVGLLLRKSRLLRARIFLKRIFH